MTKGIKNVFNPSKVAEHVIILVSSYNFYIYIRIEFTRVCCTKALTFVLMIALAVHIQQYWTSARTL